MVVTWWLLVSAVWAPAAAFELRCDPPLCMDTTGVDRAWLSSHHNFTVEGHAISISFTDWDKYNLLAIECNGWTPDSNAIPHFTTEYNATTVEFKKCPPPTRPLASFLEAMNVTLKQDNTSTIGLYELPPEPALTKLHFLGLEALSWLTLTYQQPTTDHVIEIATAFNDLRALKLGNVPLQVAELSIFHDTLRRLILMDTVVRSLSEMLRELPYLESLTLYRVEIETAVGEKTDSVAHAPSAVESLWLDRWKERRVAPMEHCESLRYLNSDEPEVVELPNSWVAACPRLEELIVTKARQLITLPAGLLAGATGLKSLNMTDGVLEALPNGLLEGAPNLRVLNLSNNRLRTIASGALVGPALRYLSLAYNLVEVEAMLALAPLGTLTELDLGYNWRLTDLCDRDGYSTLLHLTQLRQLSLAGTAVTRICRDWRVDMTSLVQLDVRGTRINTKTELEFAVQTSNMTLNDAKVLLGAPPFYPLYKLQKKQAEMLPSTMQT